MTLATDDATGAPPAVRSSAPAAASQALRSSSCAGDAEEQAVPHSSSTLTGPADADGKQPRPAAKQAQLRHHAQAAAGSRAKAAEVRASHKFALSDDAKCACAQALHGPHVARRKYFH